MRHPAQSWTRLWRQFAEFVFIRTSSCLCDKHLTFAILGLLWADLILHLSYQWRASEQYEYGWFVPVLALAVAIGRWQTRPRATAAAFGPIAGVLGILSFAWLLPLRIIDEVNPDWPLVVWAFAGTVVGITLLAARAAGGWAWVKHFGFSICFILVAVPWPWRVEHFVISNLMTVLTACCVEVLGWFGVPALQMGNTLEFGSGRLGITEACSGIRSLQSSIMASLFLGELYLLRRGMRLLLVSAGLGLALGLNFSRTLILAWRGWLEGIEAAEDWHDITGVVITGILLGAIWALAVAWRSRSAVFKINRADSFGVAITRSCMWAMFGWVIFMMSGTELWFRIHEAKREGALAWSVVLPTRSPEFRSIQLSEREKSLLACDENLCGAWKDENGAEWITYYFHWLPGSMLSRVRAREHSPLQCLPSAGKSLVQNAGQRAFAIQGITLPVNRYVFDDEGEPLFAFFCLVEDGSEPMLLTPRLSAAERIAAALTARRRIGQRTLELIVRGMPSLQDAERAVEAMLPRIVRLDGGVTLTGSADRSDL